MGKITRRELMKANIGLLKRLIRSLNLWQDLTRKKRLKAQASSIRNEKRESTKDQFLKRVSEAMAINLQA